MNLRGNFSDAEGPLGKVGFNLFCQEGNRFVRTPLALAMILAMTACAQSPDSIVPVAMGGAFDGLSCNDAAQMLANEQVTLAALEQRQRNAATGDAIGVFLLLIPISSLTGNDVTGEIAASKGKVLALGARMARC
jgi:hypothetical protein